MENKKILIIGGCGFIGSAIISRYYKNNKIEKKGECWKNITTTRFVFNESRI